MLLLECKLRILSILMYGPAMVPEEHKEHKGNIYCVTLTLMQKDDSSKKSAVWQQFAGRKIC